MAGLTVWKSLLFFFALLTRAKKRLGRRSEDQETDNYWNSKSFLFFYLYLTQACQLVQYDGPAFLRSGRYAFNLFIVKDPPRVYFTTLSYGRSHTPIIWRRGLSLLSRTQSTRHVVPSFNHSFSVECGFARPQGRVRRPIKGWGSSITSGQIPRRIKLTRLLRKKDVILKYNHRYHYMWRIPDSTNRAWDLKLKSPMDVGNNKR